MGGFLEFWEKYGILSCIQTVQCSIRKLELDNPYTPGCLCFGVLSKSRVSVGCRNWLIALSPRHATQNGGLSFLRQTGLELIS